MLSVTELIEAQGELSPASLIPLLQATQKEYGYVTDKAIIGISRALKIPRSTVYGVATFYNQFRLVPLGRHVIEVCRGTACHVRGSGLICDHLSRRLKIQKDGNSRDGYFSLLTPACLGACSIATVIRVDGEFYGNMDEKKVDGLIDELVR
ncbi:MAG TPA: NAD(P)H-dependent oxidoreductase subunit E [Acidobacteriota bacterium]|nr:NAD(P)H-dependent oxidoreductase subunit E [Acidobacteriota bacterium]